MRKIWLAEARKWLAILIAVGLLMGVVPINPPPAQALPAGWTYSKVLSFNGASLSAPTVNATVRVVLSAANFDFAQVVSANGTDIIFVDTNGATLLDFEKVSYNATAQQAVFWVMVPTLNNTEYTDYIYMLWGKAGQAETQNPAAVWAAAGAYLVYHLDDVSNNSTVAIIDATGNGNTGTPSNTQWYSTGTAFNGSNAVITRNPTSNNLSSVSIVAWLSSNATSWNQMAAVTKKELGGADNQWALGLTNAERGRLTVWTDGATASAETAAGVVINSGSWGQLSGTFDGANAYSYVGTTASAAAALAGDIHNMNPQIRIGYDAADVAWYTGNIAEVEIYTVPLPADRIAVQNMNRLDTLIYYGGATPGPDMVTYTGTVIGMNAAGSVNATLIGGIIGLGGVSTANVSFEYGSTAPAYGTSTAAQVRTTTGNYTANITSLTPGATYHFRANGINVLGTDNGSDASFVVTMPTVTTSAISNLNIVGSTSATLNGNLSTMGSANSTYVFFQYGPTTSYGTNTTATQVVGTGTFTAAITGFFWDGTLHVRSVARNGTVASYGADQTIAVGSRLSSYTGTQAMLNVTPMLLFVALLFASGILGLFGLRKVRAGEASDGMIMMALAFVFFAVAVMMGQIAIDAITNLVTGNY